MGREVRRVPENWEHPKDTNGHYVPLFAYSYQEQLAKWAEAATKWAEGMYRHWDGTWRQRGPEEQCSFEEWEENCPRPEQYMPEWTDKERTHYQMYETCTEGTPISPVCATPEELARWLADHAASAFADETATYEEWLAMITGSGSSVSAVSVDGKGLMSGVRAEILLRPTSVQKGR
jgi:hypothetical protein